MGNPRSSSPRRVDEPPVGTERMMWNDDLGAVQGQRSIRQCGLCSAPGGGRGVAFNVIVCGFGGLFSLSLRFVLRFWGFIM